MEIVKVLLEDINLQDSFFNSLRNDYPGFNNWFLRRVSYRDYAYVSYDDKNYTLIGELNKADVLFDLRDNPIKARYLIDKKHINRNLGIY